MCLRLLFAEIEVNYLLPRINRLEPSMLHLLCNAYACSENGVKLFLPLLFGGGAALGFASVPVFLCGNRSFPNLKGT